VLRTDGQIVERGTQDALRLDALPEQKELVSDGTEQQQRAHTLLGSSRCSRRAELCKFLAERWPLERRGRRRRAALLFQPSAPSSNARVHVRVVRGSRGHQAELLRQRQHASGAR
jgi:hypothetical protein